MDSERSPDKTKRLDINSEGCEDIWIVNEQIEANADEGEDAAAVAVGQRKSKLENFNLLEIFFFIKGAVEKGRLEILEEKLINSLKKKMKGMMMNTTVL